ncbi:MAG: DUF6273 domain-containing protein [Acutalibacteraceae bacterium]
MATNFGFDAVSCPGEHSFASYSRADGERVGRIALELHKMGMPIWYDNGLIPSYEWEKEILKQVRLSKFTIFFLTSDLFKRDKTYMYDEFQFADDFKKPQVCVWLDDISQMDCTKLSEDMYLWWKKLRPLHSIAVFNMKSDRAKAIEIFDEIQKLNNKISGTSVQPQAKTQPIVSAPVQSAQPKPAPQSEPKLNVRVGEIIKFGRYPQGANDEIEPIEWRVLDIKDGKALLLTEKLLDYVRYNEEYTKVTWETCTLRKWMNNDFIRKAFSSDEQRKIATVTNANPNNPEYGTKGGNPTQDKVFALSMDEVKRYFSTDKSMKAYTTDYAHKQGYDLKDRSGWWWLRSPGHDCDFAARVFYVGGVSTYGDIVLRNNVAARLALWLNL